MKIESKYRIEVKDFDPPWHARDREKLIISIEINTAIEVEALVT